MLERERLVEEILEALWTDAEEKKLTDKASLTSPHQAQPLLKDPQMQEALREAESRELVASEDEQLWLTNKGEMLARDVVRRHRLAERLFRDVLDVAEEHAESSACEFEHLLSPEATNSICVLLGHPTVCPHGKPIPSGECCEQQIDDSRTIVMPAIHLKPGEKGTVAYLGSRVRGRLDQLAAMGILPRATISLIQQRPSPVLQVGETQLALDKNVLKEIYVRRNTNERVFGTPPRKHWRWRRGWLK
ncbi:metal-dependent transcriptional regulator [Chloroflexota bacterium]